MTEGLIYVEQISERIRYFEQTFFKERSISLTFTADLAEFNAFSGKKLSYAQEIPEVGAQMYPASLLFEDAVNPDVKIEGTTWRDCKVLSFDGQADPLATMFYLITRYEEYLPSEKDHHGRFQAKHSVLKQYFELNEQTVERIFIHFLALGFPEIKEAYLRSLNSNFVPTFDIDNTYAYQWKDGWRGWLSSIKDTLKGNRARRNERKRVQSGVQQDPYDSFDAIREVLKKHSAGKLFWLLGDFKAFDKNISWKDPRHQQLIRALGNEYSIGLHPSYASNTEPQRVKMEKERLETILGKTIATSRQHFLKLQFPQTYRTLLDAGFTSDYTMGYAEETGFRAGTAHAHLWFDLEQNKTTDLRIYPFAYMDGTLNEYLKLSLPEAEKCVKQLMQEVRNYGGDFCFLWHNESFAESGIWKGWRQVYLSSEAWWNSNQSDDQKA